MEPWIVNQPCQRKYRGFLKLYRDELQLKKLECTVDAALTVSSQFNCGGLGY